MTNRHALYITARDVDTAPSTTQCDQDEAHTDRSHDAEWCGWMTIAQQIAAGER